MDNLETDFALSFMLDHPLAAVKVLEQSDLDSVATFFDQLPEHYVTPVMGCMLPEFGGKLLTRLTPARAAAIMENIDTSQAANILRKVNQSCLPPIMEELPRKLRFSIELLLTYSPRTIGGWLFPHCLVQSPDTLVHEAITYITSESEDVPFAQFLYVVDREGKLQGQAAVIDILKGGSSLPLSSVMTTSRLSLPAYMLLEQALEHKAWLDADTLPVVSRDQQFLGIITHHALRQGLMHLQGRQPHSPAARDPVSSIFDVYGKSLLAVLSTVSDAVDTEQQP